MNPIPKNEVDLPSTSVPSIPSLIAEGLIVNPHKSLANLPESFPNVEPPRFVCGDRVCWISEDEPTDWGIVIGQYYSFEPFCGRWQWGYLLWLSIDSPSFAWVKVETAWEEDLEIFNGASESVPSGSETP